MDSRGRRRRRHRNRAIAGGCVAAAGTAAGLIMSAATASGVPALRTAFVTSYPVARTLSVSGTVRPVSEAIADFQVGGTVSAVDVSKGQTVTAGQTLATIDTSSLQTAVNEAQAQLTAAEARLTADENNQPTSSSSTGNQGAGSANTAAYVRGASATETAIVLTSATTPNRPTGSTITKDEQAVVSAQHIVDLDLATAAADLAQMKQDCSDATSGSTSTTSTTSTTDPSTSPTTTGTSASSTSACAADLSTASTAEQQVATDQSKLAAAENSLAQALASQAASNASASSGGTGKGGSSKPTGGSSTPSSSSGKASSSSRSSSSAGSSGATTSTTDTPQQLASDQSTIDSDQANLVNASQSLDAATLVSPIGGTVEAVDVTTGQSVSAGSSAEGITIVSPGTYEVSASLTTSQVEGLTTGQSAQITVDSATGTFAGRVTQVGPVALTNSSYVYPVVITLDSAAGQLPAGGAADAVIDLAQSGAGPVVPTSAVHTTGVGQAYVYLDKSGKEVRTSVKVGLVGAIYTQITSGLSEGDVVVLADPSQAVPASSANANIRSFTGTGGVPGGAGTFRFTTPGGQTVQVQVGGGGGGKGG